MVKTASRIVTESVMDAQCNGRPSNASDPEVVKSFQEMFNHSPKKSIRQAAKESILSFHCAQEAA